jgi:hypothetical protein
MHNGSGNPDISIPTPQTNATQFDAIDCKNPTEYYISGKVVGGMLSYIIVTKNLATGAKSTIPPVDFFDEMWDYFQKGGIAITTIIGEWSDANPLLRTNLDQFNDAINANPSASDEDAARTGPFTGRMAAKKGYTEVEWYLRAPAGKRGQYKEIQVYFKKP